MLKAALVVNDPFIRLHRQKGCNTDSGASTRVISFQTNVQTPEKYIYFLLKHLQLNKTKFISSENILMTV